MVRYGTPALVRRMAAQAVANGYPAVKLHEIDPDAIEAGRDGAGPDTHLTIDANCAWAHERVVALAPRLRAVRPAWIEEPIYPPEDFLGLAALGRATGLPIAAGENNCTRHQFAAMIRDGAVTFPQPSVTKIGGVTEFMATVALADLTCMPHSPYFGPGYFTTLQLLAVMPGEPLFEVLYVKPAGFAGLNTPLPNAGRIAIPTGPGIGFTPDTAVFERFTANQWRYVA